MIFDDLMEGINRNRRLRREIRWLLCRWSLDRFRVGLGSLPWRGRGGRFVRLRLARLCLPRP